MLLELTIRQFAIIKDLRVTFHQGLNILTGETGAGKSIIIDAIQLLIGGRGSVDYIRNQEDKAEIEGLFDLPTSHHVQPALEAFGIEYPEDGMLLLKRELLRSGKSVCRINGQLVTLAMLKDIGQYVIQLHSQHQHQHLLQTEKQLELLDAFGDKDIENVRKEYQIIFLEYDALKKETKHLLENEKEISQRIDLLKYQVEEISQANLKNNEDDVLNSQRMKIKHAEKITSNLTNAYQMLNKENGIVDLLSTISGMLEQVINYDPTFSKLHEQLISAYYQIEDVTFQLSNQVNNIDFNPEMINKIEERLSIIHHLKRKYGESVNAILEYATTIEGELETLLNRDERLQGLQQKLEQITKKLINKAKELSKVRQKYGELLSQKIEHELNDLQMANTIFKVDNHYEEDKNGITLDGKHYKINSDGLDRIHFLISPNPGEPLKPIAKSASGGELSRIMLAIQTILASKDDIPTIIFDEIDTGVSGRAAQAIAEKLAIVAKNKQVFVVTHLPQVASMADHHYLIDKKIENNSTYTIVKHMDPEQQINEISRMLGGVEVTNLTKQHAKEMIEKASLSKF